LVDWWSIHEVVYEVVHQVVHDRSVGCLFRDTSSQCHLLTTQVLGHEIQQFFVNYVRF